ncbi:MAG: TonB-dependent receptor [Microscillaceae bacterium]|nr:TonB-dependent receptor [Microscillaceae bacterium]
MPCFLLCWGGLGVPFIPLVVNGVANLSVTNNPLTGQPFKTFHSEASANFGTNYAIELFADGTLNILDNLKVTAGIRGTYENITGALEVTDSETPGSLGIILGVAPNNLFAPTNGRREANETFFSAVGRLAVNYDVNENINLFGSVARGRRPNVVQVNATTVDVLSDETVWSYELGAKSLFLNNRLQFDLSAFYYDYNNFQTSVAVLGPNGLEIETRDAGSATALGLETAFRYLANKYLSVFANYGYIDATFDDTDSDGNAQGLAGNRFRLTPEHSISAGFEVNVPFGGERFAFFFKPTYTYRSQVFFQEENEPGIEQAGYGLLNLFAGFDLFDRATTITFYMNNALDEEYIIDAGNTGGAFGIPTFIAGLPRLWGFRLTGRF